MINWAWLGGFTDGEGSFGVVVHIRKERCHGRLEIKPCFSIVNTDVDVIIETANFLNVAHWLGRPQTENEKRKESIQITNGKILREVIPKLYPYLNCAQKRECARLVWIMSYIKSLRSMKREPLATIEILAKITQKIRSKNSRKGSKRYRWSYDEIINYYKSRIMPAPQEKMWCAIKATPELIQQAKTLRQTGTSYRAIGECLGVDRHTARDWCLSKDSGIIMLS